MFSPRLALGTPENARDIQLFLPLLGPGEGKGEVPTSDFSSSLALGTPRMHGLHINFAVLFVPREGRGEVDTSDFLPALGVGESRECRGYVAIPPTFGPPRRQR